MTSDPCATWEAMPYAPAMPRRRALAYLKRRGRHARAEEARGAVSMPDQDERAGLALLKAWEGLSLEDPTVDRAEQAPVLAIHHLLQDGDKDAALVLADILQGPIEAQLAAIEARKRVDPPPVSGVIYVGMPGSYEAQRMGCRCPVIDNHHGRGRPGPDGPVFIYVASCPIHGVTP